VKRPACTDSNAALRQRCLAATGTATRRNSGFPQSIISFCMSLRSYMLDAAENSAAQRVRSGVRGGLGAAADAG
jgi:hypothetical protein